MADDRTGEQIQFLINDVFPHYVELMKTITSNDPEQLTRENLTKFMDDCFRARMLEIISDPSTRELAEMTEDRIRELIENLKW